MSKSVQTLSTENPSSSVQGTKIDVQKMQEKMAPLSKQNPLETRIKSIEKELDQIFIDDQERLESLEKELDQIFIYKKKRLESIGEELAQISLPHQEQRIKTHESLNFIEKKREKLSTQKIKTDESLILIRKKLKQLRSFVSESKENSRETGIKRLEIEFIEKELDQIFIEDQKINFDRSHNVIKKKIMKLISLVSQYARKLSLEKHPSFSDVQQLSEANEFPKIFEVWQTLRVEDHILDSSMMGNLLLSYDLLNRDLRICLLSLAVFPENAIIKKRSLIYWWMAEGIIPKSDKESAEEVGESFFRVLMSKGIIQPRSKNDKTPMVNSCTLHPWTRRMLICKARQANIFDFDEIGKFTYSLRKSICLCFPTDDRVYLSDRFWTMFNVNETYLSFAKDFLSRFRKVKTLQLGNWQGSRFHHIDVENVKFLNDLGALKHLKYLSLRGISRISTLPSSITECCNLEILDLKGCHTLRNLPSDFGSLTRLTHLDFSECYLLESMPNNLHKLLRLQVLKGFDAEKYGSLADGSFASLYAFGHLENLRKLSVLIGAKRSTEQFGNLEWLFLIKNLRILTLTWRMVSTKHDEQSEEEMWNLGLEIQQVNEWVADKNQYSNLENLEKLDLRCFPFRRRPIWLSPSILKNLNRLYVTGGQLEDLIDAGNVTDHWRNVDILRLRYLKNLKLASDQVVRLFPCLSYFEMTVFLRSFDERDDVVSWRKAHQGWEKFPQFLI